MEDKIREGERRRGRFCIGFTCTEMVNRVPDLTHVDRNDLASGVNVDIDAVSAKVHGGHRARGQDTHGAA
jgi:hypothetical protein